MSGNCCSRCLFFDVSDKEGKNTPRSVPEPEPFMLRSKKRLKLLATTVLGVTGRFHSLLLVIGCAHTIKTEMTRLGKAHHIQESSRSCKGPGFVEQTSSLEMPLQSGWSSCSAASLLGLSFSLSYRDWLLLLFPCHQLCFPRRWRSSEWLLCIIHWFIFHTVWFMFPVNVFFFQQEKSSWFLSKCYLYISWTLLIY